MCKRRKTIHWEVTPSGICIFAELAMEFCFGWKHMILEVQGRLALTSSLGQGYDEVGIATQ